MQWNDQQQSVFLDRYALKDPEGNVVEHQPQQMWQRVAHAMADSPEEENLYYNVLEGFKFVPSGRVLAGAGAGRRSTFYNCFVIDIKSRDPGCGRDSRTAITETISRMVQITARGGGVGLNWSVLRPRGAYIRGVHGHSSGAIGWMRGADAMADQVRQGGSRTAALMFILEAWHPDIFDFVNQTERFSRANFSVAVSNKFMQAVIEDQEWVLQFPDTQHPAYDAQWDGNLERWLAKGYPTVEHGRYPAREIWTHICDSAYRIGNPGLVFLDRCNEMMNTAYFEEAICTNPCGEQPLPASGCCNLGAVNLAAMWDGQDIDHDLLHATVTTAVRFLDKVIDKSAEIDPEIQQVQDDARRIGLGTMGLADLLILKRLRYDSGEALVFIADLFAEIRDVAYQASVDLAREKGAAPMFVASPFLDSPFILSLPTKIREGIKAHGIRNLQILTQAPTGTTGIIAGASSGVEPVFSRRFLRKDATGEHMVTHPLFEGRGGPHLVTALEIAPEDHLAVQAVIQKYVDSSISKTINLPRDASADAISRAYVMAYRLKCKGITVYRNGSLEDVLTEMAQCECATCSLR